MRMGPKYILLVPLQTEIRIKFNSLETVLRITMNEIKSFYINPIDIQFPQDRLIGYTVKSFGEIKRIVPAIPDLFRHLSHLLLKCRSASYIP